MNGSSDGCVYDCMRVEIRTFIAEHSVVHVGDTPSDVEAAHLAGVKSVAVASGRFGMETLLEHSPTWLLESMADVDGVLNKCFGICC